MYRFRQSLSILSFKGCKVVVLKLKIKGEQQIHLVPMLGTPELDKVLEMGSQESSIENSHPTHG